MQISRFLAAVALSAVALGCGNDPVTPDPNATLTISKPANSGDAQVGVVGRTLPTILTVRVTNANGNPVSGKTINWTVTGGGSVNPASSVTNADGVATTTLTLGSTEATNSVTATIGGTPTGSTVFTASARWEEFISTMNSAGEPTNTNVPAVGTVTYQVVNGTTVNYTANVPSGLTGTWTGFHIHAPKAATSATAGVAVNLCPTGVTCVIGTGGSFAVSSSFTGASVPAGFGTTEQARLDSLLVLLRQGNGVAYTNLHTSVNTGGQIRGDIVIKPPTGAARRPD